MPLTLSKDKKDEIAMEGVNKGHEPEGQITYLGTMAK